jgi:hypothetical protein
MQLTDAQSAGQPAKPLLAVFSGANATIENSASLVTSNKARAQHGLPLLTDPTGRVLPFDVLRPQRLAAPVTVYVEQFSAHPLERDAAALYAPPDGYVDAAGAFHPERHGSNDVPVYAITLLPTDGLYPLPYMARQANGQPWEAEESYPLAPDALCRQAHYPDASRSFEEIDRLGVDEHGHGSLLAARADFHFYRAAPSAGWRAGLPRQNRADVGHDDISPETLGVDYFPYKPRHLRREPTAAALARLTNLVQETLASGTYAGALWLEGTPYVEETAYWLNLLVDTRLPIAGTSSQRPHGVVGNDGDRNILDAVDYVLSRAWADPAGDDRVGVVVLQDQRIYTAREVQKDDARPGGYVATGGAGGIVGLVPEPGQIALTFAPLRQHTFTSAVNLTRLPAEILGVRRDGDRLRAVRVVVKDTAGRLRAEAIPKVTLLKHGRYLSKRTEGAPDAEVDLLARLDQHLREAPLAGFVAEGASPYGSMSEPVEAILERAVRSGIPTVRVGRGNHGGFTPTRPGSLGLTGNNLTATKARLLMMACLLRFGSPAAAEDPDQPSPGELDRIRAHLAQYQAVFDTH